MPSRADSDVAQHDRFLKRGFVALPELFGAAEVAAIRAWIEELVALPETPGRVMKYFDPHPSGHGRLLNRIENFVPYHGGLAALVQREPLALVAALLGEPAILFKDKVNLKLPGGG